MDGHKPLSPTAVTGEVERLVVVFGDQLDGDSPVLRDFDTRRDAVLMMEVREEATHVPSHTQRTALFLSAMRHFALGLERKKIRVRYVPLDDSSNTQTLTDEVGRAIAELRPDIVRLVHPGEHRVFREVRTWERRNVRRQASQLRRHLGIEPRPS